MILCTILCSMEAAPFRLREIVFLRGCVSPRYLRETRAAVVARVSPRPTSFSNPQTQTLKTISRHRSPSSPTQAELRIACRMWLCCPGTQALPKASEARTAFQTRGRSLKPRSHARHAADLQVQGVTYRRLLNPRSQQSRSAAPPTAPNPPPFLPGFVCTAHT